MAAPVLIVATGAKTEFGQVAHRLLVRPPETEFERGIRRFGYLLSEIMFVLVLIVFAVNISLPNRCWTRCSFRSRWRGFDATTAAGHYQPHARQGGPADGRQWRDCAAAGSHRKLWQHGYSVY
ncbi:MAG: hypothetical protein R2867_44365 [Caldilineaceae bacterium]